MKFDVDELIDSMNKKKLQNGEATLTAAEEREVRSFLKAQLENRETPEVYCSMENNRQTREEDRIMNGFVNAARRSGREIVGDRRDRIQNSQGGVVLTAEQKEKCYAAMSPEDREVMKLAEIGWKARR